VTILKGGEIDRFLASPDPRRPVVLIYGPDSGLVSERARTLAKATANDLDDPFSVIRIDGDSLTGTPGRLAEEAHTIGMFGGKRLVWVRAGEKPIGPAVAEVLRAPPSDSVVLIEAGDLKRTAPLRTEAERSPHAAVIACYPDGEGDLKRLIADEARAAGLSVEPDAATLLVSLLGGDRAASRGEIRKLCLYAHGTERITLADVEAVSGETLQLGVSEIVDAAAGGLAPALERLLARAATADVPLAQVMTTMSRHLTMLHKARLAVESGQPAANALGHFQPPLHFSRKAAVERQLQLWTSEKLERFIVRTAEATFDTRTKADLAQAIGSRTLMAIALAAAAGRRR
jgi:DNA polymerase-3 subunit delta